MSLLFGTRSIGCAFNSSRLLKNEFRSFQTLSAAAVPTSDEKSTNGRCGQSAVVTAAVMTKATFSPSMLTTAHMIQTTRSMAGVPESSQNFIDGKPTLAYASKLPKTFASMTNEQVLQFAEMGIPEACRECVVRDVMLVDQIEYDEALKVFKEIAETNREGMSTAALPFYTGFGLSVVGGYASIPLVFNFDAVNWFNDKFVTADMPPPADLETWLEVGSASWGWMEPVLGQISFFLLCMQFARSQLQNLGLRPYFHWQQERRAARLVRKYPQYDAEFLANYSRCDQLAEEHKMSA